MKMKSLASVSLLLLMILGFSSGCGKPNDKQIAAEVQTLMSADSGLRDKQLGVAVASGVVTLSGNVENVAQSTAAASHASSVKGVKQVVNNLQIAESAETNPTQTSGQVVLASEKSAVTTSVQRASIPPNTPTPGVIHKKLGAFVYPAKNQAPDQQQYDEMDCYNWAKSQTSIDPMGPPTEVQQVEKGENAAKGSRIRGAARGAAGGAVIGAIAGDTGKGAAIGATLGTMRGGRAVRQGKAQAEQDYQNAQAQARQEAAATDKQKIATFKKAFSVCVQGRGYTVQ